jgi:hypothetical protein
MERNTVEKRVQELFGGYIVKPSEKFLQKEDTQRRRLEMLLNITSIANEYYSNLSDSFEVAAYIHRGEYRKLRAPYIKHPLDVLEEYIRGIEKVQSQGKKSHLTKPCACLAIGHDDIESLLKKSSLLRPRLGAQELFKRAGMIYREVMGLTESEMNEYINGLKSVTILPNETDIECFNRSSKLPPEDFINYGVIKSFDRRVNTYERWSRRFPNMEISPLRRVISVFKNIFLRQIENRYIQEHPGILSLDQYPILQYSAERLTEATIAESLSLSSTILDTANRELSNSKQITLNDAVAYVQKAKADYKQKESFSQMTDPLGKDIFDGSLFVLANLTQETSGLTPENVAKGRTGIDYRKFYSTLGINPELIEQKYNALGIYKEFIPTMMFYTLSTITTSIATRQAGEAPFVISDLENVMNQPKPVLKGK